MRLRRGIACTPSPRAWVAPYDLRAIREDLLKELYQELVDPQTRHDLGEFYTLRTGWRSRDSAERRVSAARGQVEAASSLDPSCGSGTFLFTAIRMLREVGLREKP